MKRELKGQSRRCPGESSRGSRVRPYEEGTESCDPLRLRLKLGEAEFVPMKRELKATGRLRVPTECWKEAEFVPMKRELKVAIVRDAFGAVLRSRVRPYEEGTERRIAEAVAPDFHVKQSSSL